LISGAVEVLSFANFAAVADVRLLEISKWYWWCQTTVVYIGENLSALYHFIRECIRNWNRPCFNHEAAPARAWSLFVIMLACIRDEDFIQVAVVDIVCVAGHHVSVISANSWL